MEKLTELSGKHKLIKDGISITAVANKLYDYEDTNLTPEDCKELIKLKGHNEHPSDNAVAHICVTLDKDGGCEQIVYGSGKKILMLIAGVIHTIANGDIEQEAMLLAELKSRVVDVTIGEAIKNSEGIKDLLAKLKEKKGAENGNV